MMQTQKEAAGRLGMCIKIWWEILTGAYHLHDARLMRTVVNILTFLRVFTLTLEYVIYVFW
jgi:hypothetical protein